MFRGGYTPSSEKRIRPIKLLTPEELPIENWPKTRILPASYSNHRMTDFSIIGRESVKVFLTPLQKMVKILFQLFEDVSMVLGGKNI